jgi:hypothetical protein
MPRCAHAFASTFELADRDPERAVHEALLRVGPRYGGAFVRRSVKDARKWLQYKLVVTVCTVRFFHKNDTYIIGF